jgi:hypothetical protein
VVAGVAFHVTTTTLPNATPGVAYSTTLKATGGKTPYTWKKTAALPKGLKLSKGGKLSGTVASSGHGGEDLLDHGHGGVRVEEGQSADRLAFPGGGHDEADLVRQEPADHSS